VIPTFLKQIQQGGPILITHPEMRRYFMTIPEAVHLVLEASTLSSDGNIYMLDMGDPVKITTMARKLVEMSGLRPDKDIKFETVGVRPGEKLHEQLWSGDADVSPTAFPRVSMVRDPRADSSDFRTKLRQLEEAALHRDEALVRQSLHEMPIGFEPQRTDSLSAGAR
jgi:FlaA1/EpsC-like NDP-sugar epimerase